MPDIFKQRGLLMSSEKVAIPEMPISYPPVEEPSAPDSESEEDSSEFEADFQDTAAEPVPCYEPEPPRGFTPAVMTREELTEYYRDDLEQLRQDATQRGYAEALSRKKGELGRYLDEADRMLSQLQQQQQQYMEQYARELKYMALEIAEKMICSKIDQDDAILGKLVLQTVAGVKTASSIDVELSERLVALVETLQQELDRPEYHGRAAVTPRACPDDTVRVTTEDGTIVASISTQAQNLREAFQAAD